MKKAILVLMLGVLPGTLCHAAPPPDWKPPARSAYDITKDKVLYEVGYAHLDTQWRWTYLDTIRDYIPRTLNDNFTLFDKYPDYTFSFTGSNRYQMMKEYYPASYARLKQYIDLGRWHVAGSSVEENDVNTPSAESIIRQILYGNHYFRREFGTESVDYQLPDCFGFPWSLPSILAHCGLKGFATQKLTWGSAVGIPFAVGRWYGPDGRYITSALDPGGYGSTITSDQSNSSSELTRINNLGASSGIFVDYRYFGTGDVGGAPTDGSAQYEQTSVRGTGPVTVVSAPSDWMFRDLSPAQTAAMPSYTGDLLLTQHSAGSITSQAYMKRWNRKNELLADAAERAAVTADWLGGATYPLGFMNETWRLILGAQFHDILPGTSLPKAYEYSWNDETVALNRSAGVLTDSVGAITRALDTTATGVPVVVYNPLSIAREDVVQATVQFPATPAAVRVYGPNGVEAPSQLVSAADGKVTVLFLARVPSVGAATYDVRPADLPTAISTGLSVTSNTLENQRYRVTLDTNGDVSSILDKPNNRQMLSGPARLALKYEQPADWPAWNIDWADQSAPPIGYVTGPATVRIVENGPVRVALEVTRQTGSSKFVQVIRLAASAAGNRVEFDNTINWNERKTTLKTEFSLAVSNLNATYNMGLGTVQRSTNNSVKYEVPSHEWFDLTNTTGDYGVSVLEDCKIGSDKPDDHTLRLTLIRTPGANSYTDEATQDVGRHRVLYALEGHSGDWRNGNTQWEAARLNQPLMAFQADPHAGSAGRSFSLLSVNSSQVRIVAVKRAEDSDEIIVRLQEMSGSPANVTLSAAAPIVSAREVTGQEDALGPIAITNGVFSVSLGAYSPRAFAIRLGAPTTKLVPPASRPLALPYDIQALGYDGTAVAKGMDGNGYTYPAELFPSTIDRAGVKFRLARSAPGARTALSCQGQTIPLPTGRFGKIYLLAASANGDTTGTFRVGGKVTPLTVQNWSGYVGQWDNRLWSPPAGSPNLPPLDGGIYGLQAAYIKRDPIAYAATHRHTAAGANDYYQYAYVFEYALDVPAGAHSITLPNAPNIVVFAMTAASNTNDGSVPAQPLYDTFDYADSTPTLNPSSGTFTDAVQVAVIPSLYDTTATLRYTTDGSTPASSSPAYASPIWLTRQTTLSVQAFHGSTPVGNVVSGVYTVNDTTAPRITGVSALAGSTLIQVAFSEPVSAATASVKTNYQIPGLTIQSATPSSDGLTVDLAVTPAPVGGSNYALKINNVKDQSAAGNTLNMTTGYPFTAASPVISVSGGSSASAPSVQPSGFTVTVTGAPAPTAGPHGTALSFNGSNDAITVNDQSSLNPTAAITLSAWINATNWAGNRRVLQKGSSDNQYRFLAETGLFKFDLTGVGTVTCALPSTGAWHYMAGTWDGKTMRLYVDGVVTAQASATGSIAVTNNSLNFGTKTTSAPGGDHFLGLLADVRVYNQAVSASHIRTLAGL
ncbi:MAG TPA: glycoside hydrolase family 38 C-terminal domain-containing protein [Armatimonadota bacterium]|jgi:alpha-mannosidase